MFFQNPLVWWLAPLVLLPFLIHFRRFLRQHTQELPSLFFIQNLIKKQHKHLNKYFLSEIIIETLIILCGLFIWSQPTLSATPQSGENLILLIDDSPSMRYFYLDAAAPDATAPVSTLLASVETLLQQNLFSHIEARRLSALSKGESQTIATVNDLKVFLKNISETTTPTQWQARDVQQILNRLTTTTNPQTPVNYLIYSDFKANHFTQSLQPIKNANAPATTETLEHDGRQPLLYALKEVSAPYLSAIELSTRHFFEREKLTLTHRIYNVPLTLGKSASAPSAARDLFLEVTLDGTQVFLSKLTLPQSLSLPPPKNTTSEPTPPQDNPAQDNLSQDNLAQDNPSASRDDNTQQSGASAAATSIIGGRVTSQVPLLLKSDLVLDKPGTHIVSVALKENAITIQRENELVFVYPKLTIRPIVKDERARSFLEALFLYDKRAEAISLSSKGDILFITDPERALTELSLLELRSRKAIVLLSPTRDVRAMETVLRNLSSANVYLSALEKMSAQSRFYWNERPQDTPAFDPSFSPNSSYLKLNPQSTKKIRTLFSIDSHPVLFVLPQKAFFTYLSEGSLLETPHPLHLVWFYEALFALNGGKRVVPVFDEAAFTLSTLSTNLTNLSAQLLNISSSGIGTGEAAANLATQATQATQAQLVQSSTQPSQATTSPAYSHHFPRIWEDANNIYIVKNPETEYNAPSLIESNEAEVTLPYLGEAIILNITPASSGNGSSKRVSAFFSLALIDCALFLITGCIIILTILLMRRVTLNRST